MPEFTSPSPPALARGRRAIATGPAVAPSPRAHGPFLPGSSPTIEHEHGARSRSADRPPPPPVSGDAMSSADDQLRRTRASEERYRAIVEASTLMVWETDAGGQVVDMPFWREITGQTREE